MEIHADLWSNKLEFISELYDSLSDSPLCYLFNGNVTSRLNDHTLSLAEDNFSHSDAPLKLKRRVFYVMIECLQNITKHQDTAGFGLNQGQGLFVLRQIDDAYIISSGNVVDNSKVDILRDRLKNVNYQDNDELGALYKKVLYEGSLSPKGGAGLGLIDIARKAGSKLAYDFKAIGVKQSFFYFQTKVSLDGIEGNDPEPFVIHESELLDTKELHKIIVTNQVELVYKGNFTHESVTQLAMMAEGNIENSDEELTVRKKIFNIMIELLQNISKHADNEPGKFLSEQKCPGIFLLGTERNKHLLTAGNWVEKSKAREFQDKLIAVNSLSREELLARYDEIIVEGSSETEKGAGLGLIDMRLKSGNKLHYHFSKIDENYTFFTVQVEV